MTTLANHPETANSELIGSRIGRIDPDNFENQSGTSIADDDDDNANDTDEEQYDEDGDPTGEHDHQQDDNYALGGHVTRSSS